MGEEEEDGGASPKKLKMETEEEALKEKDDDDDPGEEEELKGRFKMETEEESRNLSKDDEEEEDHSSFSSSSSSSDDEEEESKEEIDSDGALLLPLLEDMIEFPPPSSTLPPTPPLPSSSPTTDLDMEHQHSDDDDDDDDDGPPPGWDNKYQLREQAQQLAVTSAVSSHIQTEDEPQDAHNEEGEPRSQAHPCLPPEVAPTVEEQDSEDDGPPPGWDSKCQPESKLQETPQSDMNMEDVLQDAIAHNKESQSIPEVPSDIIVDPEDSEDEGPPPGWDSKCQPEPKLQEISQSDMKMEDVLQDVHNEDGQPTPEVPSDIVVDHENSEDEGPPPGWDAKCQPEPKLQITLQSDSSDIKTNHVEQDAQNENGPQSQSCSSPAPELVPSVEKQDLEDDGPPPGWNSKSQLEPNLQMACPTTPPSDFKIEEVKEHALDKEGSPLGWGSTPQQQSHVHSSLPSPIVQSGTGHEPNNVKTIEESPQPPSRQQSIHPMKAQITVPKPPMIMNNPEMGQMVCGSCRHLLTYPRGARYVECACCLEENYVLEEHEVGQVVCGNCNVLLMYPYGAPKVRCANCRAETEIGDQNRRPPLSEHKRRARQHLKRVQAG